MAGNLSFSKTPTIIFLNKNGDSGKNFVSLQPKKVQSNQNVAECQCIRCRFTHLLPLILSHCLRQGSDPLSLS